MLPALGGHEVRPQRGDDRAHPVLGQLRQAQEALNLCTGQALDELQADDHGILGRQCGECPRELVAALACAQQRFRIEIFAMRIGRRGEISQAGDIAAGVFLTDIEANEDGVFAVTANLNDPADPFDDSDEVRVYSRDGAELTLEAAVQTPGFPPSFKQIATARGLGGIYHVATAFQSGWLRPFIWGEDGEDQEAD
jgi:hypothetical protein